MAPNPVDMNTLALWRFEEGSGPVLDSSPNIHDSFYIGADVQQGVCGTFLNGIRFNGGMDNIILFDGPSFPFGMNEMTLEFWIKTTATDAEVVSFPLAPPAGSPLVFKIDSMGRMDKRLRGAGVSHVTGFTPINDGQWHHIAFTTKGFGTNFFDLYVDGILDGQQTLGSGIDHTPIGDFTLGHQNLVADLDEIFISDRNKMAFLTTPDLDCVVPSGSSSNSLVPIILGGALLGTIGIAFIATRDKDKKKK